MERCCNEFQMTRPMPPVAQLNPLTYKSWSRIHNYRFCRSIFKSHVLRIQIDRNFSDVNRSIKSHHTVFKNFFAQFGLPDILVSDNGTSFISSELLATNSIKHLKSAPYHPSCNGLARKVVQIAKKELKKIKDMAQLVTDYHEFYSPSIVRLVYHQHNC